uniref:Uncharacterized protein n=1 Tax=Helobdella robusta TaxID=6412 RepID=T1G1U4_HELRO
MWIPPSAIGLWLMLRFSTTNSQQIAVTVYGCSILLLFMLSTAFHTVAYCGKLRQLKSFFHIGDRVAIYIFIAASYTPWLALKEFHRYGTQTLWFVWFGAILGVYYQYKYHEKCKWLETLLYIFIATIPSIIIIEMVKPSGVKELTAGGMAYFLGVFFFKSDGIIPFAHAIWHTLVIIGVSIHYVAVCKYLLG